MYENLCFHNLYILQKNSYFGFSDLKQPNFSCLVAYLVYTHPSGDETWIFWENLVSTVAADALDLCVARSPVSIELPLLNKQVPFFQKERCQLVFISISRDVRKYKYNLTVSLKQISV